MMTSAVGFYASLVHVRRMAFGHCEIILIWSWEDFFPAGYLNKFVNFVNLNLYIQTFIWYPS